MIICVFIYNMCEIYANFLFLLFSFALILLLGFKFPFKCINIKYTRLRGGKVRLMEGETLPAGWLHSCLLGRAYHLWQQWCPQILWSLSFRMTRGTVALFLKSPLSRGLPSLRVLLMAQVHGYQLPLWALGIQEGSDTPFPPHTCCWAGQQQPSRAQGLWPQAGNRTFSSSAGEPHSLFAAQGRLCLLFEAPPWTHPEDKLLPQNATSLYPVEAFLRLPYFISLPLTDAHGG